MAFLLADYNSTTYGTKFFSGETSNGNRITSYHGKLSGDNVYCGLLLFNNPTRLGTLMVSLSSFSQRFTNTFPDKPTQTGTSTGTLITGYTDLYGYIITDANIAFPSPDYMVTYTPYVTVYNNLQEFIDEVYSGIIHHPITYHLTNCTAPLAPTEAISGSDVVVNITPSQGYILRSSGVSVVDSNGVSVPHIVQGNQIAFTMPYPP